MPPSCHPSNYCLSASQLKTSVATLSAIGFRKKSCSSVLRNFIFCTQTTLFSSYRNVLNLHNGTVIAIVRMLIMVRKLLFQFVFLKCINRREFCMGVTRAGPRTLTHHHKYYPPHPIMCLPISFSSSSRPYCISLPLFLFQSMEWKEKKGAVEPSRQTDMSAPCQSEAVPPATPVGLIDGLAGHR